MVQAARHGNINQALMGFYPQQAATCLVVANLLEITHGRSAIVFKKAQMQAAFGAADSSADVTNTDRVFKMVEEVVSGQSCTA